jgi:hypothetical protein
MLDAFIGSLDVRSVIHAVNTDRMVIYTFLVNKLFMIHLKQLYSKYLAGGHIQTAVGTVKKPSVELLCQWIKVPWQWISSELIGKKYNRCCISD